MRIGLIGASRIAPVAVIAPAAARPDVSVTAVAARDPTRAAEFANRYGVSSVSESYAALVQRDDVDVVYCALPAHGHPSVCELALAAGKAVLMEKPFAADADSARGMMDSAARAGRPLIEAFHYRFHGQFERALDLVRSGALGRIRRADGVFDVAIPRSAGEFRWSQGPDGGALMDLGCYVIHALRTLLGSEPLLTGVDADMEGDIDARLTAELKFGDVRASAACSMIRPFFARLRLEGETGTMTLHDFVAPQRNGRLVLETASGCFAEVAEGPSTYAAQLEHLVQVWRGDALPITGGADAVANMIAIDACREAARRKGGPHA